MSQLPEISIEQYAARWKNEALTLKDDLFKTECMAEALLSERDSALELVEELQNKLSEYKDAEVAEEPIEGEVV